MTKRQKWGVALLVGPFVALTVTAILQFITRFVLSTTEGGSGDGPIVIVVNIIAMLVSVIAVLALVPGFIVGIIFLATPGKNDNNTPDKTAGSPTA